MNKDDITKLDDYDLIQELIDEAKSQQYHNCSADWHDYGVEDSLRQASKSEDRVIELREELSRRLSR